MRVRTLPEAATATVLPTAQQARASATSSATVRPSAAPSACLSTVTRPGWLRAEIDRCVARSGRHITTIGRLSLAGADEMPGQGEHARCGAGRPGAIRLEGTAVRHFPRG
ncbi:hypothetical protein ACG83_04030 [Frankia sp. R43]|nr:hypothetical protein ACG83_04030 [Frankia sp. R43]